MYQVKLCHFVFFFQISNYSFSHCTYLFLIPQEGQIKLGDYDYILAHPNVLTDLVPIRGLMKRRFPNLRSGTLDPNLKDLVRKFSGGVQYRVVKDEVQENFGSVQVPVGRVGSKLFLVYPQYYIHHHQPMAGHCWTQASLRVRDKTRSRVLAVQSVPATLFKSSVHLAGGRLTLCLPSRVHCHFGLLHFRTMSVTLVFCRITSVWILSLSHIPSMDLSITL